MTKLTPAQIRLLLLIRNSTKGRAFHKLKRHYRITTWQAIWDRGLVRNHQERLRLIYPVLTDAGEAALVHALAHR